MRFRNVFTLKVLLSVGLVLALLSLLLALFSAGRALRETAAASEKAIYRVVAQTRMARSIQQMVADIERKAKLFVVLAGPAQGGSYERQSYENVRTQFREALAALLETGGDNRMALLVHELSEKERLIYEQILASGADPRLPVENAFQGLHAAAAGLWQEIAGRVDREVEELHDHAAIRQRGLLVQGALLVLASLAAAAGLFGVLQRPIRQLDAAIHGLGRGDFERPVRVTGLRELRRLGERLEWLRLRLLALEASKQAPWLQPPSELPATGVDLAEPTEPLLAETANAPPAEHDRD